MLKLFDFNLNNFAKICYWQRLIIYFLAAFLLYTLQVAMAFALMSALYGDFMQVCIIFFLCVVFEVYTYTYATKEDIFDTCTDLWYDYNAYRWNCS